MSSDDGSGGAGEDGATEVLPSGLHAPDTAVTPLHARDTAVSGRRRPTHAPPTSSAPASSAAGPSSTAASVISSPASSPSISLARLGTTAGTTTRTGGTRGGSAATTVGSPLEALERDEILRTRWFCAIATAVAFAGGMATVVLPGDPIASKLLIAAVLAAFLAVAFLYRRTFDPVAFRRPSTGLGWFVPAVSVTTAVPFFGVFSPVTTAIVLGIYFTGLGKSLRLSLAVYVVCAGVVAAIAVLVLAGVTPDTGLIRPPAWLSLRDRVIIQGLVQVVFLATFITARMSRRTALAAVGELEQAVRLAAHREALLLEAREELERALRQGRGRFTDQVIGGYQLGAVLGRGAMGEVYEAEAAHGGKVAIKLLSQASLGNANHVIRFLRELRTAAGVRSPNIVEVIEVGEHPVPYLVMERLEGQTLAEILRGKKQLRHGEVVELVTQIGAGITAAAGAGIVHRDLKPQNVFRHGATWKILDFGVARGADAHGEDLTAGQVVGTPSYMAPEQASGGAVDHLSDLYSLTAVAYRALTGHPPFAAGEIAETLYKVVHTRPRRPSELVDLPVQVDHVLAIGMAKDPRHRFTSASELAVALAGALAGTLPAPLAERARVLEKTGAWSVTPARLRARRLTP